MFAKAGLFLVAGIMIIVAASKNINQLKGISSVLPLSVFTLSLSSISLIGFPPTLGFSAKWYYLQESLKNSEWILFIALLCGTFITAFYLFKLIIITLMQKDETKDFIKPNEYNFTILQSIAFILSLSSVLLGFFSVNIIEMIGW